MPDSIKDKLKQAIKEERSRGHPSRHAAHRAGQSDAGAFAPVRKAAQEITDELVDLPELRITINPESVWVELYDKHFCFAYDAASGHFMGDELSSSWLEREQREETYHWDTVEECVDGLVRACARYVVLAHAITGMRPRSAPSRDA